jgi:hypothetical protein
VAFPSGGWFSCAWRRAPLCLRARLWTRSPRHAAQYCTHVPCCCPPSLRTIHLAISLTKPFLRPCVRVGFSRLAPPRSVPSVSLGLLALAHFLFIYLFALIIFYLFVSGFIPLLSYMCVRTSGSASASPSLPSARAPLSGLAGVEFGSVGHGLHATAWKFLIRAPTSGQCRGSSVQPQRRHVRALGLSDLPPPERLLRPPPSLYSFSLSLSRACTHTTPSPPPRSVRVRLASSPFRRAFARFSSTRRVPQDLKRSLTS